ncbi:peptidoglycan D,D-transpeptidase FtsI family protein [Deinococcus ruber]|uniref:Penicillin-binding protein 2 n=1 Tax=Deinococcus ruber TaxID=1848197 RepID=A0A918BUW8_9DEIO|nr:penicillin-binding protein 2 [Deinococcus ruber]GGQ93398.1 penicillin-binding protein 2 [Deinococcus ruber]
MEMKIRVRSRVMHLIALLVSFMLVWAYAQLEWGLPQGVRRAMVQVRGSIVTTDGSVLARSVGDRRVYPNGSLAGQLLGMMGDTNGLEGLEAAYDSRLAAGQNVTLTLDPAIQAAAEGVLKSAVNAHQAEYGSVVALDTKSGKVLAVATYPAFDPNTWKSQSASVWRNRAFLDTFEPGSTIKGLVVAAALQEHLTTPNTLYDTPMSRRVGGRFSAVIHDAVQHPPTLTTQLVLRYSSNVGMSHVVEHFPNEKLYNYLTSYGFGQSVPMPTVRTSTGRLQPLRRWDDVVRTTNAFGQGMSATLLQLATAYNTLANGGLYVAPRLVEGEVQQPPHEVISAQTARTIRELLHYVVSNGIPHEAGIEGYDLAGKTGTAQVVVDGRYSDTIYDSVFAGFFPSEQPRVTLAVMVHGAKEAYHGSMLAAPIYRDVAAAIISKWAERPVQVKSANAPAKNSQ